MNMNYLLIYNTIQKINQALKGKPKTEKHKQKIRLANLGKKFSKERCQNISIAKHQNFS
jgi:hypothetical protein